MLLLQSGSRLLLQSGDRLMLQADSDETGAAVRGEIVTRPRAAAVATARPRTAAAPTARPAVTTTTTTLAPR